ncbi:GNAT family N-acetyltransferase [Micrococcus luteus]|uniref:GNAT family N-acetyltransferase n=1 Tax=Micrococcus sp. HOU01 TaxID=3101753 RepID=UPI002D7A3124|nr:GNAT family N-acetyltransferase [Micrococcus sp. HOU1]WRQ43570.1 GNAT family N-acetyltransferase [Micrococcus sp. HOU1]
MILHITLPEDWAEARRTGRYAPSTRGAAFPEVGFLHASEDVRQAAAVAAVAYADRPDAFLAALDEKALAESGFAVRREPGDPTDPASQLFPHVHPGTAAWDHVPVQMMTPVAIPGAEARVLREDTAEAAALQDAGWTVRSRSWGARLHLADDAGLAPYRDLVAAVEAQGVQVRVLEAADSPALRALDTAAAPRFPRTDGSFHTPVPEDLEARIAGEDGIAVGAFADAELIGFTLLDRVGDGRGEARWDVDRTAVRQGHEGRGVGTAVKAASVLATHARGGRVWGTGGAQVNTAALRMNEALGFELEPLWLALVPPAPAHARETSTDTTRGQEEVKGA